MAISRSDMSSFISHVLEKRYQPALQHLQSMLSTFEPKRYLLARKQAAGMVCAIAAQFHSTMSKTLDGPDERLQPLQFLIDCYSITGDSKKKLTARLQLLSLRQTKATHLHSAAENNLKDWMSFGRECVTHGYHGNGVQAFDKATQCGPISSGPGEQTDALKRLASEATLARYNTLQLKNSQTGTLA